MQPFTRITLVLLTLFVLTALPTQAQSDGPPAESEPGAPDCPTDVNGYAPVDTGGVFFSWTLRSSTDVNIYKDAGDGEFVFLERLDFPATRYLDHDTEPGKTYAYTVTAIDENGTESQACDTAVVTTIPYFPSWASLAGASAIAVAGYAMFRRRR